MVWLSTLSNMPCSICTGCVSRSCTYLSYYHAYITLLMLMVRSQTPTVQTNVHNWHRLNVCLHGPCMHSTTPHIKNTILIYMALPLWSPSMTRSGRQANAYIIPSSRDEILTVAWCILEAVVSVLLIRSSIPQKHLYTVSVQQTVNCKRRKCILISVSFLLDVVIVVN